MSEETRRRKRIIYYPQLEGESSGHLASSEPVEVEPRPLLIRQSRPYIFPIIGQLIETILQMIEARLQAVRSRSTGGSTGGGDLFPRRMTREIVRDDNGRIIEETFEVYGGSG